MSNIELLPLSNLRPAPRARGYRIAPTGWPGDAHERYAEFSLNAEALWRSWLEFAKARPRTTALARDDDGMRSIHEQRSPIFRFPDRIRAEIVPLGPNSAGLVLDSRAKFALWDFGVNRRRVLAWARDLEYILAAGT